jgi:transcriptional regulator of arginine metabolism
MNINSIGLVRRRRAEILKLVAAGHPVRSQEELQQLLRRRGFTVAQPTLSRDLKDLGLMRTPTGYASPSTPSLFVPGARREDALDRALAHSVLAAEAAGTLVVVKTPPGEAHPVARALDESALPGVVGTIAGDDTVFVATPSPAAALRVERRLRAPLTATRPKRRAPA